MGHDYKSFDDKIQIDNNTLFLGDALNVMQSFSDASINLILVDPPYFQTKLSYRGQRIAWDRQWPTRDAYLAWLRQLAKEWQRILAPNGSLYCFAAPQMAAYVEVLLGEVFTVLNHIRWVKEDGWHKKAVKEELRSYLSPWDSILFCEQPHADSMALGESGYAAQCEQLRGFVFEPIRAYLDGERRRAGISKAAINAACGFAPIAGAMASRHYFSPSQWCLPTQEHYHAMQELFNTHGQRPAPPFFAYHPTSSSFAPFHMRQDDYLRTDYEALRTDYEALRTDYEALRTDYEALRRPFTVSARVPYTDVWDFTTVQAAPGKHPCEKPLPLLRHIIEASSRPGDTVLDCCMGSGSTLDAARQCGRQAIGIEQDAQWYQQAVRRLSQLTLPLGA